VPSDHVPENFFSIDKKMAFLLLCLLAFLLLFIKISFIENETAAFEFLADRPGGGILQTINALKLLTIPVVYAWKFLVIGFVVWMGCFMFGYRVTYWQAWGVVILAEYIFLVPELLKIGYYLFIERDPTYYSIRGFYPFSLMNFFDYETIDKRFAYPLRALNVFEPLYWWLLSEGIHFYARKSRTTARLIVAGSYIPLFILWLLFYMVVYK
jgi:hypothetical protein